MAGIKNVTDCVCGRDFAQFAKDRDKKVVKNHSYFEIEGNNGYKAHVPDCDKAMSKPERNYLVQLFIKLGIVALVLGGCIGAYRLAETLSAAMGM